MENKVKREVRKLATILRNDLLLPFKWLFRIPKEPEPTVTAKCEHCGKTAICYALFALRPTVTRSLCCAGCLKKSRRIFYIYIISIAIVFLLVTLFSSSAPK